LKRRDAYLDGEVVALTPAGVSDFGGLQEALSSHKRDHLVYYVFDLLHLAGKDLRREPLRERKAKLAELLATVSMPRIRLSEHIAGGGAAFFKQACKARLEGIVSKRADAPYRSGRGGDWLKVKCTKRQELVVGGWKQSDKKGRALASLLLGYYDKGKLTYAGKVGTGFGIKQGYELVAKLSKQSENRHRPYKPDWKAALVLAQAAPRCHARRRRSKVPCRGPAMRGKPVCRLHGGKGGGPTGDRNGAYRTGRYTAEAKAEQRATRALLLDLRRLIDAGD
jgi:ATP-dependent DNA ligase